jgi:hypothetical protein
LSLSRKNSKKISRKIIAKPKPLSYNKFKLVLINQEIFLQKMIYCFSINNFTSQNRYSIPVLLKKPTTNHPPHILAEIRYTAYCAFVITSLVYSEILNVLNVIATHIRKYICLETKLQAYFILFLFRKNPGNISRSILSPFYLTRIEMIQYLFLWTIWGKVLSLSPARKPLPPRK